MNGRFGLLLSLCLGMSVPLEGGIWRLYYLGGQSNMDGYGKIEELPAELLAPQEDVWIFHGNPAPDGDVTGGLGLWARLRPGHGRGFSSDGTANRYSDAFGAELSLAARLKQLYPGEKIAFIKYSRGGTSIDVAAAGNFGCWDPDFEGGQGPGRGLNQWDHFLSTLRAALSVRDIDQDGVEDTLVPAGIVWMQGESDAAWGAEVAGRYQHHLKRLMDLVRAALRVDDLPVAVGLVSDSGQDEDGKVWDYGFIVRAAQRAWAAGDSRAVLVTSTDGYHYSDKWHYDSFGYLDLGERFAEALKMLDMR
jgi:hypothetical protein